MIVFGDWGTTNLRIWLVDADGNIKKEHISYKGFKKAVQIGFSQVLESALIEMEAPHDVPVWLAGMIGARHGWHETPYYKIPASIQDIADNIYVLKSRPNTFFIRGLYAENNNSFDVIRGEEVQLTGIIANYPEAKQICLPGTHSKWVRIREEKIEKITTFMTGELFDIISSHSLLSGQIESKLFDKKSFEFGIQLSKESIPFTQQLFKLRTDYLFEKLSGQNVHSALSGFLIGQELRGQNIDKSEPVYLCGSDTLMSIYQVALDTFGIEAIPTASKKIIINGFMEIYKRYTK